ncbi:MAG: PIG-L family deacetylase [Chloroflexota bacterium]|nr:PIG-L family deacetylase [Chloroflexota bacterium]
MGTRFWQARSLAVLVVCVMLATMAAPGRQVGAQATPGAETPVVGTPAAATPEAPAPVSASPSGAAPTAAETVDLDVLFIGAHPDDEAFGLSTYGIWNEEAGVTTGVITITRGEGGGNAAGPEEGPALGLLREAEERRAVGRAGIQHIYNLDKVDFYYNVSAPLTEEIWGVDQTLEKVVRVVRATRPEVITTMNPSPTPGNHGHHQVAARLAIEAFSAAADPDVFPEQIQQEGLLPWRVQKIFRGGAAGEGPTGPLCASTFVPADPTDVVYGVWAGTPSTQNGGKTWAEIERAAQREYISQGWGVFPDVSTDPTALPCDYFTLVDSRVPYTAGNSSPTAMLEGALVPAEGGFPLGTEFYLTTDRFNLTPGQSFTVTAHARASEGQALGEATVELAVPPGWMVDGDGTMAAGQAGGEMTTSFTVSVPSGASVNTRVRMAASLSVGGMQAATSEVVRVVPAVLGTVEALPHVAQFRAWAAQANMPQLDNLIDPRLSLGVGETRPIRVDLTNFGETAQSGTVALALPEGFSVDVPSQPFDGLAPGAAASVTFNVTNSDPALATGTEGGDYPLTLTTTSGGTIGTQRALLNLVPVTTVPQVAAAPTVDGLESPGEYPGPTLDLSRVWEGDDPDSPADASGTAKVAWSGDDLYVLVHVVDDTVGTVLPVSDAKRHWRTDSVEIAVDPRGTSENTSTTFKVGAFPTTVEGQPAAYRDADNRQGPVAETAPGLQVASQVSSPYTGYTLEVRIPLSALPAAVDPAHMTMNIFIYDSDTQDKTGQTRLGWSPWRGVQGDPYRWGRVVMEGYMPPADRPTQPAVPVVPLEPTRSVTSPQSILQSAMDGVPLAGDRAAPTGAVTVASGPTLSGNTLSVDLQGASEGTAHVFFWNGTAATAGQALPLTPAQTQTVTWQLDDASRAAAEQGSGMILVGFETGDGAKASMAEATSR